ncbi:MAG: cell division protein FtsZ [Pseudomonadota bacterium]
MSIKINVPDVTELKPRITVMGVGGAGGNAINNMIDSGVSGVNFVAANTDSQALTISSAEHRIQMGINLTEGLGAGSHPEIGEAAAQEAIEEIKSQISGSHMVFVAAGMGGGTGTGAAPVIAEAAKSQDILTVAVVTKPFQFEGQRRMKAAEKGVEELRKHVDTLIVIPNQNLFRIANEKTTFSDAFKLADQVLHAGIACITDLIMKDGLINLDFADVRAVMSGMGSAMMGTGEASGERRALRAAEEAICNPLLDDVSMRGAKALLISITGASGDLTLYEIDEAASRIREDVAADANIILGATYDESLNGQIRVSIVASGIGKPEQKTIEFSAQRQTDNPPPQASPKLPKERKPSTRQASSQQDASLSASPPSPQRSTHFEGATPSREIAPSRKTSEQNDELRAVRGNKPQNDQLDEVMDLSSDDEIWHGDNDVKIRTTPPHMLPSPNQMIPIHTHDAERPRDQDSFIPSAPMQTRRRPRKMPDIEDFSEVGKKELRARGQASHEYDDSKQKKKKSIFERLASVGRSYNKVDSNESGFLDDYTSPERSSKTEYTHRQDLENENYSKNTSYPPHHQDDFHSRRKSSSKKTERNDEGIEIPSFLHREVK